jgi:hypothetical protein
LKKEIERLKFATGEIMAPTDSYNLGMHHIPYNHSLMLSPKPYPRPVHGSEVVFESVVIVKKF